MSNTGEKIISCLLIVISLACAVAFLNLHERNQDAYQQNQETLQGFYVLLVNMEEMVRYNHMAMMETRETFRLIEGVEQGYIYTGMGIIICEEEYFIDLYGKAHGR